MFLSELFHFVSSYSVRRVETDLLSTERLFPSSNPPVCATVIAVRNHNRGVPRAVAPAPRRAALMTTRHTYSCSPRSFVDRSIYRFTSI